MYLVRNEGFLFCFVSDEDIYIQEGDVEDIQEPVNLNIVDSDVEIVELPYVIRIHERDRSKTLSPNTES